jgi:hypothetical protein
MQSQPPVRRYRFLYGESRELMAKRDTIIHSEQHARRQAHLQVTDQLARERLEQPHLNPSRNDRSRLQQPSSRIGQPPGPSQDSIAHRPRNPLASRLKHLSHEKRIAARPWRWSSCHTRGYP